MFRAFSLFTLTLLSTYVVGYSSANMNELKSAAEQGNANAQCNLDCSYQLGRGIEADEEEGIFWYKKAAAQGLKIAQDKVRELGIKQQFFGLGI